MHELGHSFGSSHTHDSNHYAPLVDACGQRCSGELPSDGSATLMSTCQHCPGGYHNFLYTFGGKYSGPGPRTDADSYVDTPALTDLGVVSVDPRRVSARMYSHIASRDCAAIADPAPPPTPPAATGSPTMKEPTKAPTKGPTAPPTDVPTEAPTKEPTKEPTDAPTPSPTKNPTSSPTKNPTSPPTEAPTAAPTATPTTAPTKSPTKAPTENPTRAPVTAAPTNRPTHPGAPPPIWILGASAITIDLFQQKMLFTPRAVCVNVNDNVHRVTGHSSEQCAQACAILVDCAGFQWYVEETCFLASNNTTQGCDER